MKNSIDKILEDDVKDLGSLCSILVDLTYARKWLEKSLELFPTLSEDKRDSDYYFITGLWTASLISYSRCFTTSKRIKLNASEIYKGLKGDPMRVHEYYLKMRDKHIAHSVNPFEQVYVSLLLSPLEAKERKVEGISVFQGKLICFTEQDIKQFVALISVAQKHIAKRSQELQDEILEYTKKIKIEDLSQEYKECVIIKIPSPDDVIKAR